VALVGALALVVAGLPAAARPAGPAGSKSGRPLATPSPTEPVVNLSQSPGVESIAPQIARTDDGTLHVLWEEGVDVRHVYQPPGQPWGPQPPIIVYSRADQPALAARGDSLAAVVVVQEGEAATDTGIRLREWSAGTARWGKRLAVTRMGQYGQQPDIAIQPDDHSYWVAWVNNVFGYKPYWTHLVPGEAPKSNEISQDSQKAQGPSIAVDAEGGVWVAWKEEAQPSGDSWITCRRQSPGGGWNVCSERTDVLRGETFEAHAPDLALAAPGACIAWHNGSLQNPPEAYLACDANAWAARNLSESPRRNSLAPRLALDPRWGPLTAWDESTDPNQVALRPGLSPTTTLAEGEVSAPALAFEPRAAEGYGYVHAVWEQDIDPGEDQDWDIFYTRHRVNVPTPTPTASPTRTASATPSPTPSATAGTPPTPSRTPAPRPVFAPFVQRPAR
jgi:hypothetical protein